MSLHHVSQKTLDTALESVREEQLAETAVQMQAHPSFQLSVMQNMTEEHRIKCTEILRQREMEHSRRNRNNNNESAVEQSGTSMKI